MKKFSHGTVFIRPAHDPPLFGTGQAVRQGPHMTADDVLAHLGKGVERSGVVPRNGRVAHPRKRRRISSQTVKIKEIVEQRRVTCLFCCQPLFSADVIGQIRNAEYVLQAVRAHVVTVGRKNTDRRVKEQGMDEREKGAPILCFFGGKGFFIQLVNRFHGIQLAKRRLSAR